GRSTPRPFTWSRAISRCNYKTEIPACQPRCRGALSPSNQMRTHMPIGAWIIAQAIEAQGNKKSFAAIMLVYYAGLPGSHDEFADHAPAASRCPGIGLVPAWADRGGPPGEPDRRIGLDRLQPIIDPLHRATDLGRRGRTLHTGWTGREWG